MFVFADVAFLRILTSRRMNRACDTRRAVEMQERAYLYDSRQVWIGFPNLGELQVIPMMREAGNQRDERSLRLC